MKEVNIVLFGIGNVGKTLIGQLLAATEQWQNEGVKLRIPVIANSTTALIAAEGISAEWNEDFGKNGKSYKVEDIVEFVSQKRLKNLIAVDATASKEFVENYIDLVQNKFHLIAANKIANTLSADFYSQLRQELQKNERQFLYETNVGAGLPVVETLRNLHRSGEKVTKIRGVFSGSLSFIFNRFSKEGAVFSEVLEEAAKSGYTEPDAREDLSGNDVGRKLLILARELQLKKELSEVQIHSLIPSQLNGNTSAEEFKKRISELDEIYEGHKNDQNEDHVLRYVGEIEVGSASLEAKLISEPKTTALGQIKGADNIFEIYTESYKDQPLVIQGAGAGAAVTARGVVTDILKLSERLN
ncbi:MAG: aspartate kinase [Salegentibacter sp.]